MSTTSRGDGNETPVLDHGYVKLLDVAGSDVEIVRHARTSTGKDSEHRTEAEDKKLLFYLYKNRHTSPFEMAKIWLEVMIPIFLWRQWARHRMQNMNEMSGRYTELPDNFYIPKTWRKQSETNKQASVDVGHWNPIVSDVGDMEFNLSEVVRGHCAQAYALYEKMLVVGVAKEQARMVLPINLYTKMHVCFDLHNLLHFIRLRDDSHAQSEMQAYGKVIGHLIDFLFPWTWEAYKRYKVVVVDTEESQVPVMPTKP